MAILTIALTLSLTPTRWAAASRPISTALRYLVITPPRWAAASCPTSSGASPLCTACSRARGPATCWRAPSAAPGYYLLAGPLGRPGFPSWLGKNSTMTKRARLLREFGGHMQATLTPPHPTPTLIPHADNLTP
eukprot:scaffold63257_cov59-Phaeocystis_antarctica.AAC.1